MSANGNAGADGDAGVTSSRVLVINAGSSSLKAALIAPPETTLARTEVSWGADASRSEDRPASLAEALAELGVDPDGPQHGLTAVGYRVVHGGARFTRPVPIDETVLGGIRSVSDLAPLHNGVALEAIEAGRALLPDVPHIACFDTAFHATLEESVYRYPLPEQWYREWGIRRYGFHGLSVDWSVTRSAAILGRDASQLDLVVAHLGSGCSVTAVHGGRSVATSMGLTPLEGLMMGTRSGSIDPGVPSLVAGLGHLTADEVTDLLDHGSGLLAVGGSSDMRELQAAADAGDERACLALSMFTQRAAAWIAHVATALPRLDAIVFTGGIGEHADAVRRRICDRLAVLGVAPLPPGDAPNTGDRDLDGPLSEPGAAVAILRVTAREDLVIAEACTRVLERLHADSTCR